MKDKIQINLYRNGAIIKLENRRVEFEEKKDGFELVFKTMKNIEKPSCITTTVKGKIKETVIGISKEAMELLFFAYQKYQDKKS